jgi:hypothetical protein
MEAEQGEEEMIEEPIEPHNAYMTGQHGEFVNEPDLHTYPIQNSGEVPEDQEE